MSSLSFSSPSPIDFLLVAQRVRGGHDAGLLGERRLGEILALLVERELGLGLPIARLLLERGQRARDLLAVGDRARGRRANLDERVLHLLDHEAHELFGILGLVEDRVDVRVHDVGEAREDTHGRCPLFGDGTLFSSFRARPAGAAQVPEFD